MTSVVTWVRGFLLRLLAGRSAVAINMNLQGVVSPARGCDTLLVAGCHFEGAVDIPEGVTIRGIDAR